jgi:ABC-type Fe3+/spermidine/putrescine transport system ATPase subunit
MTVINCDMGEVFGLYRMGDDEGLMPLISVANMACGFHASDFNHMPVTVQLAKKHGVKVGAQFIGRNTLIPGTVKTSSKVGITLDAPYGALADTSQTLVKAGAKANLVLPAESADLLPAKTPKAQLTKNCGSCSIPVEVQRIQQIGHIVQMDVSLGKGRTIGLAGHADKYGGRFAAGDAAFIAWKKNSATVIVG